jgi:hypothetical protein
MELMQSPTQRPIWCDFLLFLGRIDTVPRIDNLNLIETLWKDTTFGHQALILIWHSVTLENPSTKP